MKKALAILFFITLFALASDEEPMPSETEEVEDIIHWKQEEMVEYETEITIEELVVEEVTEPQHEVKLYNVPLSEDLQMYINAECEKYNISPAIVIAMIDAESDFDTNAVSPYGDIGLMQINPKWHQGRMDKLGCTNLFNPYQNITVGIDYISELKSKNSDLYWVLMAYNQGMDKATERIANEDYSKYALGIVERATELQREIEQ